MDDKSPLKGALSGSHDQFFKMCNVLCGLFKLGETRRAQ